MIEKEHSDLSLTRQCDLLTIHRSKLNRELMRLLDEQYLNKPYYGVYRMWEWLNKDNGYKVNIKRVRRLCRLRGLEAIGPKPNTSKPAPGHTVYPYLLKNLKVTHNNYVWATDITYVPMAQGFLYLMAIIDLKSRHVLNWSVSNTMDAEWCAEVFREAVRMHGAPDINQYRPRRSGSPAKRLRLRLPKTSAANYQWMVKAEQSTTFSLSGYGEALNMSTFTSIRQLTVLSYTEG